MAGGYCPGAVCDGTARHGADTACDDRRDAVHHDPSDTLLADGLPDVPGHEFCSNASLQGLPGGRTCWGLASDSSVEFPYGALLADLLCRTGRKRNFPMFVFFLAEKTVCKVTKEASNMLQSLCPMKSTDRFLSGENGHGNIPY